MTQLKTNGRPRTDGLYPTFRISDQKSVELVILEYTPESVT